MAQYRHLSASATFRLCRVPRARWCVACTRTPQRRRTSGPRRPLCEQEAAGASDHALLRRYWPTSDPKVKADEKTRAFLDMYQSQRGNIVASFTVPLSSLLTSVDSPTMSKQRNPRQKLTISSKISLGCPRTQPKAGSLTRGNMSSHHICMISRKQEADLPETQCGLVISEIAQIWERAVKLEREKMREVRESILSIIGAQSGPKAREWGKPQNQARGDTQQAAGRAQAAQQAQAHPLAPRMMREECLGRPQD